MEPVDFPAHYRDGRHYDAFASSLAPDDEPFWSRQVEKFGQPALELACGTGRITIPLAEKGVNITGLDITEPLLAHAGRKAAEKKLNMEWVQADCRDFDLNRKYKLIFIPFNSIGHLHSLDDVESCFACARRHLLDDGAFIVDFFNPRLDLLTGAPDNHIPVTEYPDPDGGGMVEVTETYVYDPATQIKRIKWHHKIEGKPDKIKNNLNIRIYFPQELDALLSFNGFEIEAKYGDYNESPFNNDSPKQLIVCRKKV